MWEMKEMLYGKRKRLHKLLQAAAMKALVVALTDRPKQ